MKSDPQNAKVKPFPLEVFPETIQTYIRTLASMQSLNIDILGSSVLWSAGLAIGNSRAIDIDGMKQAGAVLWLNIVADTGTNKTQAIHAPLEIFIEEDSRLHALHKTKIKEYEDNLSNSNPTGSKPSFVHTLYDDYTPEALLSGHERQLRGIGIYNDEIDGWHSSFDRYNNGGEEAKMLKIWNLEPVQIDRKGSEPVRIRRPFIPVIGGIQPNLLNNLVNGKDSKRKSNGYLDRILFVFPDNVKRETKYGRIDKGIRSLLTKALFRLLALDGQDIENSYSPKYLPYSDDCWAIIHNWDAQNDKAINDSIVAEGKSIRAKIATYLHRFALILEGLKYGCNESDFTAVSKESVEGAVKLCEYFEAMAFKTRNIMLGDGAETLNGRLKSFYELLPNVFTKRKAIELAKQIGLKEMDVTNLFRAKNMLNDTIRKVAHGQYEKM